MAGGISFLLVCRAADVKGLGVLRYVVPIVSYSKTHTATVSRGHLNIEYHHFPGITTVAPIDYILCGFRVRSDGYSA